MVPSPEALSSPSSRAHAAVLGRRASARWRFHDRLDARVLVVQPLGVDDGWTDSAPRESAGAIPGVRVSIDRDAVEARRFGAVDQARVFGCVLFDVETSPSRRQSHVDS